MAQIAGRRAEAAGRRRSRAIARYFAPPPFETLPRRSTELDVAKADDPAFAAGSTHQRARAQAAGLRHRHHLAEADRRHPGRRIGRPDGRDRRSRRALFSFDELRVTHAQNLVLPHVRSRPICSRSGRRSARSAWRRRIIGLITDIIACPGLDYCALANARSIPIAQRDPRALRRPRAPARDRRAAASRSRAASTPAAITMSATSASSASRRRARNSTRSCSAARPSEDAAIGKIVGPGFSDDEVVDAVETIVDTYLGLRAATASASSTPIAASASRRSRRRSMPLIKHGGLLAE